MGAADRDKDLSGELVQRRTIRERLACRVADECLRRISGERHAANKTRETSYLRILVIDAAQGSSVQEQLVEGTSVHAVGVCGDRRLLG